MGSSPTINVPQASSDLSLETIMNLARSLVNDTQAGLTNSPGEGQILVDNPSVAPFTLQFLMSAIREVYRELRNISEPMLIKDNILIFNLPLVNSPTYGEGQPDPSVQTYLSTSGYFDGVQLWPDFLLPSDCIYPTMVYERQTGTTNYFVALNQPQGGLMSRAQTSNLAEWEWRNGNINFVGATTNRDIRLRYYCTLPTYYSDTLDFSTTYVPIPDCTDAVAYKVAVKYATMLGSAGLDELKADAQEQMRQLKNGTIRRMQSQNFIRQPFGNSSTDINNNWFWTLG